MTFTPLSLLMGRSATSILLGVLLATGPCLAARPSVAQTPTTAEAKTAKLERLPSGHLAVTVRVNDQGPFRLVLDTGSPVTFLGTKAAAKLGLTKSAGGAGQGLLSMLQPPVQVKSFAVGDARLPDMTVMILNHPTVDMLSLMDGPLDGIVGFSFFSRFRTTLDYAASTVTFQPTDYQPPDIMQAMMNRLMGPGGGRRVIAPAGIWGVALEKGGPGDGISVTRVYASSAAEKAGLHPDDRILTLDGRWTDSVQEFYEAASLAKPGQKITVGIVRDGKPLELEVAPRAGL
jgi:membrane-associated protease RseP (regulator of RpoE activity)